MGKSYCGLSLFTFARGILYNFAHEHGFNKIALGHHRNDLVKTLFLNLFYGGKIKLMSPKLKSDDGRNIVIRPLAYCNKRDIGQLAQALDFPVLSRPRNGETGIIKDAMVIAINGISTGMRNTG